ncbi:MAG: sensor domain-containing diguanylate cyclase [Acidimicrobiales bacterium]
MSGPVDGGGRDAVVAHLFDLLPEMIVVMAPDGSISLVNQRLLDTMGYQADDIIGTNIFDYVHPDDLAYMAWSWEQRQTHPGETGILVQARGRDADGSWRPVEIVGLSLLDDPVVGGMVMTMRDLRAEGGVDESPARLRSLIDRTTDVVLLVDAGGTIQFANRRLTSQYGHDNDRVAGTALGSLLHPDDVTTVDRWLADLVAGGDRATARLRLRVVDPGGVEHPVEWLGTNQLGDPLIAGVIISGRDITDLVAMEAQVRAQTDQLRHAADHDPLTGLANRGAFLAACEHQVRSRRDAGDTGDVVVLFCDLDRFKQVNDTHGHEIGDRVLVAVAERLRTAVRDVDLVARYGGDEFTVLLGGDISPATLTGLVARIQGRLTEPIAVGDVTTDVGVSVGVGRAPVVDAEVDDLLRRADRAMYDRKPTP